MARKDKAADDAAPAIEEENQVVDTDYKPTGESTTQVAAETDVTEGVELLAGASILGAEGLIKTVYAEIKRAQAAGDHAAAGVMEMLHVRAGEFLTHLRMAESSMEGELLAAIHRLKALL